MALGSFLIVILKAVASKEELADVSPNVMIEYEPATWVLINILTHIDNQVV